jgi:hypothetical protein
MRRTAVIVWLVVMAFAAVVPLVREHFAPATAHLSCGSYVTITPNGQDAGGDESLRPAAPPLKVPCGCGQHNPSPGRTPCQGPWCSENHGPAPTPTTTVERADHGWACLWSALGLADADSQILAADPGRQQLVRRAGFIFHPPRAV